MSDWKDIVAGGGIGIVGSVIAALGGWKAWAKGAFEGLVSQSVLLDKKINEAKQDVSDKIDAKSFAKQEAIVRLDTEISQIKGSLDNLTREDWNLEFEKMQDNHALELRLAAVEKDLDYMKREFERYINQTLSNKVPDMVNNYINSLIKESDNRK